jgi:uncharacterized membrane protein YbhN (UPF0104 family)
MLMYKRKALLAIQIIFYIAVIWFIAVRFDRLIHSVDVGNLLQRPLLVILSVICFLGFYAFLALHWKLICDKYAKFPQQHQWLSFFASQPYKYLPSSIFAFSSRAVYAKKLGLPIKQSTLVQLLENMNIVLGGFLVAVVCLAFQASLTIGIGVSTLTILCLCGAVLIPSIKVPKSALYLSGREWVKLLSFTVSAWIFSGTAFYLIVLANGQSISYVTAVAANSVAVGLGILAVFAPGGIGVREFVFSRFNISSGPIITWRLLTLIVDVIVGASAIYAIKRTTSKKPRI